MKRSRPGTTLLSVLADYGPPSVVMAEHAGGEPDPLGRRERPAGTAFTATYYLAQDAAANFGLNLTFCFDHDERLLKVVEHW